MSKKESVFKMIRFIYKIYPSMFPLIVVCPMDDWVECGTYPALSGAAEGCK